MLRFGKLMILFLIALALDSGSSFAKIRTAAANNDEQRIYEVIYRLQRGIQKQNMALILDNFIGEKVNSPEEFSAKRREIVELFNGISNTFQARNFPAPFGPMSNTRDFRFNIEGIDLQPDGSSARVRVTCGFPAAPVDSSYLDEISPSQITSMSDQEKQQFMQFRPAELTLIKVENNWNIASFGSLPSLLRRMDTFYAGKLNTTPVKKK